MTTYIATRNTPAEMATILNTNSVPRLNQKLAKTLRQAAMDTGIKQTVKGARLEFYPIDDTTFNDIKTRDDMLIAINSDDLATQLKTVNSKAEYQNGMDYRVHEKYKKELRNAMASIVVKIGMDVKAEVIKRPSFTHDYAHGDWIQVYGDYGNFLGNARICRVTDKSYWYQLARIDGGHFNNLELARLRFKDVDVKFDWGQEWDFTIPFAGNEEHFTFGEPIMRRASEYNPSIVTPGYRSERTQRD